jgi:hypothetical protein
VSAAVGPASPAEITAKLAAVRDAVCQQHPVAAPTIRFAGQTRTQTSTVLARLRVTGSYRFAAGPTRRLAATLGREPLRLTGPGDLRELRLQVETEAPAEPLRPTALRADTAVRVAAQQLFESALATQYRTFLANPDPVGKSSSTYRYELAPMATPASASTHDDGSSPWPAVGIAVTLAVVAVGGIVVWAHS